MNNSVNQAVKQVARKLCVDQKLVEQVYRSYWRFIKEHISSLNLRNIDKEEFDSIVTNFNIPYIGKLYVGYGRVEKYKKQFKKKRNDKVEENQANGL
jgi:hypothetical protein